MPRTKIMTYFEATIPKNLQNFLKLKCNYGPKSGITTIILLPNKFQKITCGMSMYGSLISPKA